jgi:hypothetical protein
LTDLQPQQVEFVLQGHLATQLPWASDLPHCEVL